MWACRMVGRRVLVIEVDIFVGLFKWKGIVDEYVWFPSRSDLR